MGLKETLQKLDVHLGFSFPTGETIGPEVPPWYYLPGGSVMGSTWNLPCNPSNMVLLILCGPRVCFSLPPRFWIFPRCFVYEELLIVLLMRGNEVENDLRMTSPAGWCHSVLSIKISTSVKHLVEYQNNNIHCYSYMWILSLWAHCETNASEIVSVPLILRDNILLVFWHILVWFHFSMLLIKKLKYKYGWLWSYN